MAVTTDFIAGMQYYMLMHCKQFELERRYMPLLTHPQAILHANNACVGYDMNSAFLAQPMPLGQTFYEQRLHSPIQINDVQYNHSFVQPEQYRERSSIVSGEYERACHLNCVANEVSKERATNSSVAKLEHANKRKLAKTKKGTAFCATKKPDFEQSYKHYLTKTENYWFKRRNINSKNNYKQPRTAHELNTSVSLSTVPSLNQSRSHLSRRKEKPVSQSTAPSLNQNSSLLSRRKELEVKEIENKRDAEHKKIVFVAKSKKNVDNSCEAVKATSKNIEETSAVNLENYIDIIDEIKAEKACADEIMYKEFEIMDRVESNENGNNASGPHSYCDYIELLRNKTRLKEVPSNPNIKVVKLTINKYKVVPMKKRRAVVSKNYKTLHNEPVVNNNFPSKNRTSYAARNEKKLFASKYDNSTRDDFDIDFDFLNNMIADFNKSTQKKLEVTVDSIANILISSDSNTHSKQNCNLVTWITKQGSNKDFDMETYVAAEEYNIFINN